MGVHNLRANPNFWVDPYGLQGNAPPEVYPPLRPVRPGSRAEGVGALQELLNQAGYGAVPQGLAEQAASDVIRAARPPDVPQEEKLRCIAEECEEFTKPALTQMQERTRDAVNQAISESSMIEMLTGQAGSNVDQQQRYVDTPTLGTIDLQHVISAAVGPPGAPTVGGLLVEIKQLLTDPGSAFKAEDIISNVFGGNARDRARRCNISIGEAVARMLGNAGAQQPPYRR